MKIAILSDIHGNIEALNAVLAEVRSESISTLFILGDFIGYYYQSKKVLDAIHNFPQLYAVRGNHEDMLMHGEKDERQLKSYTGKYGHSLSLALQQLGESHLSWLRHLPKTLYVEFDGKTFLLCHGAPWDTDAYIYQDSDEGLKSRCFEYQGDYILLGQTHYSMRFERGNRFLLNPGSVGQNRRKGGVAEWLTVDTTSSQVDFRQTSYEIRSVLEEVQQHDPELSYLQKVLLR